MPGLEPQTLLYAMLDANASDLHIKVGVPPHDPRARRHGPLPASPP